MVLGLAWSLVQHGLWFSMVFGLLKIHLNRYKEALESVRVMTEFSNFSGSGYDRVFKFLKVWVRMGFQISQGLVMTGFSNISGLG